MKHDKLRKDIYYISFGVIVLFRTLQSSTLFSAIPDRVFDMTYLFAAAIFLVKFILDKHSAKELVGVFILSPILFYLYIRGMPYFVITAFLGFISIRDVNIKTIIKIDLVIKAFFLVSHLILFGIDCATDPGMAETAFFSLTKGTANSLYFKNPNTAGIFGMWAIIDYLYLKQSKKLRTYIIPTMLATIVFTITVSRSALAIYVLYLMLLVVKNRKLIYFLCKIAYPLMFLASALIIMYAPMDNEAMIEINRASSWRISSSIAAFKTFGANLLPMPSPEEFLETNVIDNFYVRCLTYYGLITAALYFIPYLLISKCTGEEAKKMAIVSAVHLLLESVTVNIGAIPIYLVMADAVINENIGKRG